MNDLDAVRQKIDIVSYISEYIPLKKAGRNFKGSCPFHHEKTASFIVSPERQIWHCFGACQTGGDIFSFLMRMENIEFAEALQILAQRAGVTVKSYEPDETTKIREKIYRINSLAAEYYYYLLSQHEVGETARQYLTGRKISEGSWKLFKIGYAPKAWDSLIKYLAKKGYTTSDLSVAGLVSVSERGHYFDRFRGRVIFTLFDHRDNVVGFAARTMDPEAKEAKYINTAETPVYTKGNVLFGLNLTKEAIREEGSAVVVEGEIDAIQSFQAGVKNIVAIKGSALTEGQVHLLKRYTDKIILSLDADYAGDSAARRGIETADHAGLDIRVARLTYGKDPDECIKHDPGLWKKSVSESVPFYDFIIDSAAERFGTDTGNGKGKVVAEVSKFLMPLSNLVIKSHYIKKLSKILDIPEEAIAAQIETDAKKAGLGYRVQNAEMETEKADKETGRREKLEDYLLSLLLQSGSPLDQVILIKGRLTPADFSTPARGKIYEQLISAPEKFSAAKFIETLPAELIPLADRLYLTDVGSISDNIDELFAEISTTAWEIRDLALMARLSELSELLKKDDDPGAAEEFRQVSLQLQTLRHNREMVEGEHRQV